MFIFTNSLRSLHKTNERGENMKKSFLKAGCSAFQCRKQVFSPTPWKKFFDADPSCRFRKKAKNAQFNSEKWRVTEPKARLL